MLGYSWGWVGIATLEEKQFPPGNFPVLMKTKIQTGRLVYSISIFIFVMAVSFIYMAFLSLGFEW